MPENYQLYYCFTRFAIELNEPPPIDSVSRGCIPITDSRLRPDQRLLEEGQVDEAEMVKMQIEQAQRDRIKPQQASSITEPADARGGETNRKDLDEPDASCGNSNWLSRTDCSNHSSVLDADIEWKPRWFV
ncbi:unnamed protein product [Protopolystoma xenopodis]|uniref:Uncharacterized protein n=1 Tax=Protopolystoma xenopodis TaxID=117903 RepID=A0A448WE81_9PLAT|nr:unnamed protein product [Protopolystoma xenopodis]